MVRLPTQDRLYPLRCFPLKEDMLLIQGSMCYFRWAQRVPGFVVLFRPAFWQRCPLDGSTG